MTSLASTPANASGVFPYQSMAVLSAPASSSRLVQRAQLRQAAICKGVQPSRPGCDTFGSAPASSNNSTHSGSFRSQALWSGV
eukprot:CAMPEP_0115051872 /NCGR_PEP_ID=MMETSP0227-20121206/2597_1 /TAXON_ID=89957 /ORGANISM="Polarella glacialis, Strain CCMP 1383" /LENGTH=82 /DNA_ID=CAMNT_0002435919 /DNA_START=508 /DNA_END=756 /DNA_ORIENTATION=-